MIPTIDKIKTGESIKALMKERNFTPNDIMEFLNLSCVQTVYRWLEGVNIPSIDNLYALSCLFRVRVDDLLVGRHGDKEIARRYIMAHRLRNYCHVLKNLNASSA